MKRKTISKSAEVVKPAKQMKGFAVMGPRVRARIASMGGKAVAKRHGSGYMAAIGSKGGSNSHKSTNSKGDV